MCGKLGHVSILTPGVPGEAGRVGVGARPARIYWEA